MQIRTAETLTTYVCTCYQSAAFSAPSHQIAHIQVHMHATMFATIYIYINVYVQI